MSVDQGVSELRMKRCVVSLTLRDTSSMSPAKRCKDDELKSAQIDGTYSPTSGKIIDEVSHYCTFRDEVTWHSLSTLRQSHRDP